MRMTINMGSCISAAGFPFMSCNTSTKAAIDRLTESLRIELLPLGINVHLISPGAVKTAFDDEFLNEKDRTIEIYPHFSKFTDNIHGVIEHTGLAPRLVGKTVGNMIKDIVVDCKKDCEYRYYCNSDNKKFHGLL